MKWKLSLLIILSLLVLPLVFAQTTPITLNFPENDVTYGPWSDSYFDYPRTGGKAHHIRLNVSVGEDVAYYRIMRNNEWVQYVGNRSMQDAVSDNSIIEFQPDDLEPLDLIGYLSALQNLSVIAYDIDGNELGRDSVVFYIAVNLDDYYELISSEGEIATSYSFTPDALDRISVSQEVVLSSSSFFTLKQYITQVTVRNKFTGDLENHTRIRLILKPALTSAFGQEVDLYAVIPKEIVETLHNLTLTGNYTVIDADPIMMWHFAAVEETETLEYDVTVPINTEEAREIVPIAISEIEGTKTSWYFMIPLVIPIILLFA
ncbi:MAG: hypothetical protein AABX82_00675, partial [Nanoarchaeota archaeon]